MRFIAVLRTAEAHGFPPPEPAEGIAARFMDLHRRTWRWEGESDIRKVFGPES